MREIDIVASISNRLAIWSLTKIMYFIGVISTNCVYRLENDDLDMVANQPSFSTVQSSVGLVWMADITVSILGSAKADKKGSLSLDDTIVARITWINMTSDKRLMMAWLPDALLNASWLIKLNVLSSHYVLWVLSTETYSSSGRLSNSRCVPNSSKPNSPHTKQHEAPSPPYTKGPSPE